MCILCISGIFLCIVWCLLFLFLFIFCKFGVIINFYLFVKDIIILVNFLFFFNGGLLLFFFLFINVFLCKLLVSVLVEYCYLECGIVIIDYG